MDVRQAYEQLCAHSSELSYLSSVIGLLHWDERTCIPPKGHHHRAGQLTVLARLHHRKATAPIVGELLGVLEGSELTQEPASIEEVNIREWRRSYDRTVKISEELAVALARASAEGQAAWEEARPRDDWPMFKQYLETLVSLKREQADALGYSHEPYDALLDLYEVGETARHLEPMFQQLREALGRLLERIQGSSRTMDPSIRRRYFPLEDQRAFATEVARSIGYDMDGGRLDVSSHPFTSGIGPGDVRITTRYDEHAFGSSFFSVLHETGHALYHQGLPIEHWGTPICRPTSLGINESQSRLWENFVGRSRPFWTHFFPLARQRFAALEDVSQEDFYGSINEVHPSLIRTEADEVTYNLHVMLRFELELLIMRREVEVEDLPDAWNEKMREYLGLTPPDYSSGVMQDIHWSSGAIGYFPTYTLGNLCAAQFFRAAEKSLGPLCAPFERGELMPLLWWLREHIHWQGARYLPRDLVRVVTGEELSSEALIWYLDGKYGELYGV